MEGRTFRASFNRKHGAGAAELVVGRGFGALDEYNVVFGDGWRGNPV